ncbi:hypothetical protein [Devosia sp. CAU 1758]
MASVNAAAPYSAYQGYGTSYPATTAKTTTTATTAAATTKTESAATAVTLSDQARAALAERDLTAVLADARHKLTQVLDDADRTSPLSDGKLAVDLSSLDQRELYALSSDDSFTPDERAAAGLEMQRRFEAALSGPFAIAQVTSSFIGLYKAAAAYLDALGPEERASADWKAGRDALTEGLKQLKSAPDTLPDAGASDPVALYLVLTDTGDTAAPPSMIDLAANVRTTLDKLYEDARANGRVPTFNRATTIGTYIDVSGFSSRALSAMVLDSEGTFTGEEVRAANTALQAKSGATLLAGFQSASKSGDPTAFSQNIIAAYSSLSEEERLATGWSDQLYQAAMESYASTSKLMSMFTQATGNSSAGGLATLLGRQ